MYEAKLGKEKEAEEKCLRDSESNFVDELESRSASSQ